MIVSNHILVLYQKSGAYRKSHRSISAGSETINPALINGIKNVEFP